MHWLLETGSLFLLAVLVLQDVRHRAYHWVLLPPLLTLLMIKASFFLGWTELLANFLYNLGIVALLFLGVKLFIALKEGHPKMVTDRVLGSGDLLLMAVLGAAFSPLNFVIFLTLAFIVSLIFMGLIRTVPSRGMERTVPLAGILALSMTALELALFFKNAHSYVYEDRIWAVLLYG